MMRLAHGTDDSLETHLPDEPVWDWPGRRVTTPRPGDPSRVAIAADLDCVPGVYMGVSRNDPMAMLPFCGYNMNKYFGR